MDYYCYKFIEFFCLRMSTRNSNGVKYIILYNGTDGKFQRKLYARKSIDTNWFNKNRTFEWISYPDSYFNFFFILFLRILI